MCVRVPISLSNIFCRLIKKTKQNQDQGLLHPSELQPHTCMSVCERYDNCLIATLHSRVRQEVKGILYSIETAGIIQVYRMQCLLSEGLLLALLTHVRNGSSRRHLQKRYRSPVLETLLVILILGHIRTVTLA